MTKKQDNPKKNEPMCPRCGGTTLWKCGRRSSEDGQRMQCRAPECGWKGEASSLVWPSDGFRKLVIKKKRLVITAAQNATPVFKRFWDSLLVYCEANDAQLVVIPYRYHNPTSVWLKGDKNQDWWDENVQPYLVDMRSEINENLILLADIKTQPTATSPLSGFEAMTGSKSAIIGHPKLELTSVPTPQSKLPKILTTTAACTRKNYTPTKAGKKGEFHHTYGACVVELEGRLFHMRQINAVKDGSFMDINGPLGQTYRYAPEGAKMAKVSALVMGDSHLEFLDPEVSKATFGHSGLLHMLTPDYVVWHDVHDFYSRNHHHINEPFIDYVKHVVGTDNVEVMLDKTALFIKDVIRENEPAKHVFVPSNHPDALAKWVKRADWKTDPRNAPFLLRTILAMIEHSQWSETGANTIDPFTYWMKIKLEECAKHAIFLNRDEGFMIQGIDVGQHGDAGPNGARGSRNAFAKVGVKSIIGHSHSPGIRDGVYQVGTNSRLQLEFVKGPSSWLHTDCVIYENGKRSLINIINGQWRAHNGKGNNRRHGKHVRARARR